MDSIESLSNSQSFSSTSKKNVNNNYKLAVKYFMNKSFQKSFELIAKLYEKSFHQFSTGVIPEQLFIKIVNFYLIQVGIILDSSRKDVQVKLTPIEEVSCKNQLATDNVITQLREIYGSTDGIPYEIVYNLYTSLFINRHELVDEKTLLDKFNSIIYTVGADDDDDVFLRKLLDLYVFEVLPSYNKFDEARNLIQTHAIYSHGDELESNLSKLAAIKSESLKNSEIERKRKLESLAKKKELEKLEKQRAEEQKREENLNYRTLKQIRNSHSTESAESTPSSRNPSHNSSSSKVADLAKLKQRLFYQLNISKEFLVDNYPVLVVVIISLLVSTRFIRSRKINVKEKLMETLRMALKVSYL